MFALSNIVIQSAINSLGTVVMAASSAAFNIEVITYDILNSFSQACTTFGGQNFGAGELRRCKRTLLLCIAEGILVLAVAIPRRIRRVAGNGRTVHGREGSGNRCG